MQNSSATSPNTTLDSVISRQALSVKTALKLLDALAAFVDCAGNYCRAISRRDGL
jgi:aspartate carbamoyltransferase regulatory subunit